LKRSRRKLNDSASAALNKLGEEFVDSLCASFEAKGAQVIRRVREENPRAFVQLVAGLTHEQIEPDRGEFSNLSTGELERMLEGLATFGEKISHDAGVSRPWASGADDEALLAANGYLVART
jgi:hypothetical protein